MIGSSKPIVCVEATSASTSPPRRSSWTPLESLCRERGRPFFFIGRNIALVQSLCEKIYSVSSLSRWGALRGTRLAQRQRRSVFQRFNREG